MFNLCILLFCMYLRLLGWKAKKVLFGAFFGGCQIFVPFVPSLYFFVVELFRLGTFVFCFVPFVPFVPEMVFFGTLLELLFFIFKTLFQTYIIDFQLIYCCLELLEQMERTFQKLLKFAQFLHLSISFGLRRYRTCLFASQKLLDRRLWNRAYTKCWGLGSHCTRFEESRANRFLPTMWAMCFLATV